MTEPNAAASVAPYVERAHTSRDSRVVGGTITNGGPNQYPCGFYPSGSHGGCVGCGGRGWYVEGREHLRPPELRPDLDLARLQRDARAIQDRPWEIPRHRRASVLALCEYVLTQRWCTEHEDCPCDLDRWAGEPRG